MDHSMAGATGLEPVECKSQSLVPYRLGYAPTNGAPGRIRTPGTWIRSPLLYPTELQVHNLLERVKGIEPSQPAWKAGALPLSYTRILVGMSGFEPLKAKLTDLQSVPFGQLWNIPTVKYKVIGADDRT